MLEVRGNHVSGASSTAPQRRASGHTGVPPSCAANPWAAPLSSGVEERVLSQGRPMQAQPQQQCPGLSADPVPLPLLRSGSWQKGLAAAVHEDVIASTNSVTSAYLSQLQAAACAYQAHGSGPRGKQSSSTKGGSSPMPWPLRTVQQQSSLQHTTAHQVPCADPALGGEEASFNSSGGGEMVWAPAGARAEALGHRRSNSGGVAAGHAARAQSVQGIRRSLSAALPPAALPAGWAASFTTTQRGPPGSRAAAPSPLLMAAAIGHADDLGRLPASTELHKQQQFGIPLAGGARSAAGTDSSFHQQLHAGRNGYGPLEAIQQAEAAAAQPELQPLPDKRDHSLQGAVCTRHAQSGSAHGRARDAAGSAGGSVEACNSPCHRATPTAHISPRTCAEPVQILAAAAAAATAVMGTWPAKSSSAKASTARSAASSCTEGAAPAGRRKARQGGKKKKRSGSGSQQPRAAATGSSSSRGSSRILRQSTSTRNRMARPCGPSAATAAPGIAVQAVPCSPRLANPLIAAAGEPRYAQQLPFRPPSPNSVLHAASCSSSSSESVRPHASRPQPGLGECSAHPPSMTASGGRVLVNPTGVEHCHAASVPAQVASPHTGSLAWTAAAALPSGHCSYSDDCHVGALEQHQQQAAYSSISRPESPDWLPSPGSSSLFLHAPLGTGGQLAPRLSGGRLAHLEWSSSALQPAAAEHQHLHPHQHQAHEPGVPVDASLRSSSSGSIRPRALLKPLATSPWPPCTGAGLGDTAASLNSLDAASLLPLPALVGSAECGLPGAPGSMPADAARHEQQHHMLAAYLGYPPHRLTPLGLGPDGCAPPHSAGPATHEAAPGAGADDTNGSFAVDAASRGSGGPGARPTAGPASRVVAHLRSRAAGPGIEGVQVGVAGRSPAATLSDQDLALTGLTAIAPRSAQRIRAGNTGARGGSGPGSRYASPVRMSHTQSLPPSAAVYGYLECAVGRSGGGIRDPQEEVKRAQERLEAYRRSQDDASKRAVAEEASRKARRADERTCAQALKERRRTELYALNAVLRMCEEARTVQLLSAMAAAAQQQQQQVEEQAAGGEASGSDTESDDDQTRGSRGCAPALEHLMSHGV